MTCFFFAVDVFCPVFAVLATVFTTPVTVAIAAAATAADPPPTTVFVVPATALLVLLFVAAVAVVDVALTVAIFLTSASATVPSTAPDVIYPSFS